MIVAKLVNPNRLSFNGGMYIVDFRGWKKDKVFLSCCQEALNWITKND